MSGKKDCKFCDKKGLLWLPLRYSAVGVDTPDAISSLPTLSGKLGKGVTDLALTEAKYAVRLLRSGYLYVLLERKGIKYWEAYMVLDDAFLDKFTPEDPPQTARQFSCEPHTCGINASMVAIPEAKDVPKLWALFTPSPLTRAKLAEYKANADKYAGEGKMQTFSPADWLAGSTAQPHTLLAPELLTKVAEYVLFTQPGNPYMSPLGKALEQQLFPASVHAYCGSPPNGKGEYFGRLGGLYNAVKRNGYAAMALYDHIGVTQELNDFRNAAFILIESYLLKADANRTDNQRKLMVSVAIEDVRTGLEQTRLLDDKQFLENHRKQSDQWFNGRRNQVKALHQQGRITLTEANAIEKDIDDDLQKREQNYAHAIQQAKTGAKENWIKKYEPRINRGEIEAFEKQLKALSEATQKIADSRADDHIKWATASRLVDAFDTYDNQNLGSGFAFHLQHSICTFGMIGAKKSADLVEKWLNVTAVERTNLYMRANLFNQKTLEDEAKAAFQQAKELVGSVEDISAISGALWLKASKGLVDGFKKVDSAWDEWLRDKEVKAAHQKGIRPEHSTNLKSLSRFHTTAEGMLFARMSDMSRCVSRAWVGGKLEKKAVAATIGMLLYSRLGDITEKIAFDEFMLKIPSEKLREGYKKRSEARAKELAARKAGQKAAQVAGQIDDSIETLMNDARKRTQEKVKLTIEDLSKGERGPTNNYHQARIGAVLMAIEGMALHNKYQHFDSSMKAYGELSASVFSLTSIGLDTVYSVAKSIREIEPYKSISAIEKATDIVRGGFKITAGALATAAGGIGAVLDGYGVYDQLTKDKPNPTLAAIYLIRGAVGARAAYLGWIAACSYAGPMLNYIAKNSSGRMAAWLTVKAGVASTIALERTWLLIRVARFNLIGLAVTGVEIGYRLFIMDDTLQDWLDACTFRENKGSGFFKAKPFHDAEVELKGLYQAFEEMK